MVPTPTFERLFAFLVLGHDRRRLLWFEVTRHPTAAWLARQITEAFPWASAPAYLVRDNDRAYGHVFTFPGEGDGHPRPTGLASIAVAKPVCRASDWHGGRECLDRVLVFGEAHLRQRRAPGSGSSADRRHCRHPDLVWATPPLRPDMIFGRHSESSHEGMTFIPCSAAYNG